MNERKAKIISKDFIILDENCNFDELVKDIFDCFTKHNAIANFGIFEFFENKEETQHNNGIKNIIEKALEKRKK